MTLAFSLAIDGKQRIYEKQDFTFSTWSDDDRFFLYS
jgi:hypothetical protein